LGYFIFMIRGTEPSLFETRILDNAREGLLPSGIDFLTVALNAPTSAMDTLDELCDTMGVEPRTAEEIADLFGFDNPAQREEFLRRL
jgi:hypothetical protein